MVSPGPGDIAKNASVSSSEVSPNLAPTSVLNSGQSLTLLFLITSHTACPKMNGAICLMCYSSSSDNTMEGPSPSITLSTFSQNPCNSYLQGNSVAPPKVGLILLPKISCIRVESFSSSCINYISSLLANLVMASLVLAT